jgi:hypothetical protein
MTERASVPTSLAQVLDKLVEQATEQELASFRALTEAAGLNPAHDFVGASLQNIDFRDEDLRGFDFSKADLTGADFRRANVAGVRFDDAILTGTIGLYNLDSFPSYFSWREEAVTIHHELAMKHVFLSYVRENTAIVDRLYIDLSQKGINVWLDRKEIKPGERFSDVIRSAIRNGAFFIACFSAEAEKKQKTFMNEELLIAIDELRQLPPSRTWFIPIKLNDCSIPDRAIGNGMHLTDFQWLDMYPNWGEAVERLASVVKSQPDMDINLKPLPAPRMLKIVRTIDEQDANGNVKIVNASIRITEDNRPILTGILRATGTHSLQGNAEAPWLQVELMNRGSLLMVLDSAGLAEVREPGKFEAMGGDAREIDLSTVPHFKPDLVPFVDSFCIVMPGGSNPSRS